MDEIIIDTIVFDYLTRNQKSLSPTARKRIEQADTVYVSVMSIWELANHIRQGLIVLDANFDTFYQKALQTLGVALLDTQWSALSYLSTFDYRVISKPWQRTINGIVTTGVKQELHKDPFDRMTIAHGLTMNLPVVSPDTFFLTTQSWAYKLFGSTGRSIRRSRPQKDYVRQTLGLQYTL